LKVIKAIKKKNVNWISKISMEDAHKSSLYLQWVCKSGINHVPLCHRMCADELKPFTRDNGLLVKMQTQTTGTWSAVALVLPKTVHTKQRQCK